MAGMFNLRDILEWVDNRLKEDGAFAQEFIHQGHECVFHVRANTCHQLNIEHVQQFIAQCFGDVASIGEQFAKEFSNHIGDGLAILEEHSTFIDIARREQQVEQFATIIENQVQFEAKEPASGGFASLRQPRKDFVRPKAFASARSVQRIGKSHRHRKTIRLDCP